MLYFLLFGFKFRELIRKEKSPENGKHNEQFYEYKHPQSTSYGHAPETVHVKCVYSFEYVHYSPMLLNNKYTFVFAIVIQY